MAKEIESLSKYNTVYSVFFDQSIKNCPFSENEIGIPLRKRNKIINIMKYPFMAWQFASRRSSACRRAIRQILDKRNIQAAHIEYAAMGQYIKYIKKVSPQIECNLILHDVTYQSYLRQIDDENNYFKRVFFIIQARLIKCYEGLYIKLADHVIVFSEKDKKLVSTWYNRSDSIVISTFFDVEQRVKIGKNRDYNNIDQNSICFFGQLGRDENANAARRLLNIAKKIYPSISTYIVGNKPPKDICDCQSENIFITGFVDNPDKYLANCAIAVFPLTVGAGIKIKVLHCLALGIPIITTKIGAEGIDERGEIITIVETDEEFFEAINHLRNNPDLQKIIGKKGVKLVEDRFSWDITTRTFDLLYNPNVLE